MSLHLATQAIELNNLPEGFIRAVLRHYGVDLPGQVSREILETTLKEQLERHGITTFNELLQLGERNESTYRELQRNNYVSVQAPPPFLNAPGEPPIVFSQWVKLFANYFVLIGGEQKPENINIAWEPKDKEESIWLKEM